MSDPRPTAWVLNLDAELELAHGPGYTPNAAVVAASEKARPHIAGLIGPQDIVLHPLRPTADEARGYRGEAWCPTPSALRALEIAGAEPPLAPSFEVLREVNHRAFPLTVDPGPLRARVVYEQSALDEHLRSHDGPWRIKRALSFAGRGHRRITRALDEDDRRWCESAFRRAGGLLVELEAQRLADFGLHGWVGEDGCVTLGRPLVQHCTELGAWTRCEPVAKAGELALLPDEAELLKQNALAAGRALHAAGYFGPYGLDAFRYLAGDEHRFHPLVEINARYSMAWGASGCAR